MKTEVLSIILNRPNVRTVEIADRLDMDLERVRPLIADEIARGVIVEEEIIAPNGRPVMSFRYAEAKPAAAVVKELPADPFPARVLRALPPTERPVLAAPALAPTPAPTSAPKPAPKPADPLPLALSPAHVPAAEQAAAELPSIDVPVTAKPGAFPSLATVGRAKKTRVDIGIDFLHAAGGKPVTNAELGAAMGLPVKHSPAAYLRFALADGRVMRKGADWVAGPALLVGGADALMADFTGQAEAKAEAPVAQEPDIGACVAGIAGDCECDDCKTVAALQSDLALSAPVKEAPALEAVITKETIAALGGLPRIKTPHLPPVADGAPDITRNGLYENGEFRKSPEEILVVAGIGVSAGASENVNIGREAANDADPARFLAGVMSDGSLYLSVPGNAPMSLSPEHARELYQFLSKMGYAAWPTAA